MSDHGFLAVMALAAVGCGPKIDLPAGSEWPTPPAPAYAHRARLVLTDNGDDTMAVVSTDLPPQLLGMVPVGDNPVELEGPHHLAASPDGKFVYVGLSNYVPGSGTGPHGAHGLGTVPGSILKLRATDLAKVGEAVVDRSPGDVILTRDGRTAIVSHYDILRLLDQLQKGLPEAAGYSAVSLVDTATMHERARDPVCPTAHGLVLSPDEKTVYTSCSLSDELAVLDLATHKAVRLPVGPGPGKPGQPRYAPYAVSRSPADDTIWISCNGAKDGWSGLRVYDPKQHAMDASRAVPLTGIAMFSAFRADRTTLVVPHQGDDKLSLVDTITAKEIATIPLPEDACLAAHAVFLAPDDRTAYVVCEGDHVTRRGSLVAVDLAARAVVGYVTVGLFPDGVVLLPPG